MALKPLRGGPESSSNSFALLVLSRMTFPSAAHLPWPSTLLSPHRPNQLDFEAPLSFFCSSSRASFAAILVQLSKPACRHCLHVAFASVADDMPSSLRSCSSAMSTASRVHATPSSRASSLAVY